MVSRVSKPDVVDYKVRQLITIDIGNLTKYLIIIKTKIGGEMENTYMNYDIEHPGVFLRDELEERGWLQSDLAYILGCPVQSVNTIISGKRGITVDMARSLEKAFDVPSEFFLNLQKIYDLSKANEPDAGIAKKARFYQGSYPIRDMFKRGWLEDTEPDLLEAQMSRMSMGMGLLTQWMCNWSSTAHWAFQ